MQNDVSKQERLLADANQKLQSVLPRLDMIRAEIAGATINRGIVISTIEEVKKSAASVQELNDAAAASLAAISTDKPSRTGANWQVAREKEREGFMALIDGKFDAAGKAFQASEDAVNGYHYAYELARLVRKRRADLDDPAKRKDVFREIVTRYTLGAPRELVDRLRELAGS